jgi:hypothetical protein
MAKEKSVDLLGKLFVETMKTKVGCGVFVLLGRECSRHHLIQRTFFARQHRSVGWRNPIAAMHKAAQEPGGNSLWLNDILGKRLLANAMKQLGSNLFWRSG